MEEQLRVPDIRFKNFDDSWQKSQLNEICHYSKSNLTINDIDENTVYPLFDANGKVGHVPYPIHLDRYISIIKDGAGVGRVRLLPGKSSFLATMGSFTAEKNNDLMFLYFLLQNKDFSNSIKGSTIPHIYFSDYGKDIVHKPEKVEQQKIGEFFKNIDSLITNSCKKYNKLQNIKKALLEKMFPKDGENVPEIRFKGFTDDWEKMSFKDIFSFLQSNSLSREKLNFEKGEAYNIHYGDILIKFGECLDTNQYCIPMIDDNEIVLKYQSSLIENGDIIFADAAEDETVGKCCEILGLTGEKMLSGLHTIPCRPNIEFAKGFLGYFLNSNTYHDQLLPLMQGTKVSSISKTALTKTSICFPKNIDEQKKIGSYLIKLDNTIKLHKEKHDRLMNIKKALLEKMFV